MASWVNTLTIPSKKRVRDAESDNGGEGSWKKAGPKKVVKDKGKGIAVEENDNTSEGSSKGLGKKAGHKKVIKKGKAKATEKDDNGGEGSSKRPGKRAGPKKVDKGREKRSEMMIMVARSLQKARQKRRKGCTSRKETCQKRPEGQRNPSKTNWFTVNYGDFLLNLSDANVIEEVRIRKYEGQERYHTPKDGEEGENAFDDGEAVMVRRAGENDRPHEVIDFERNIQEIPQEVEGETKKLKKGPRLKELLNS
ncbi:uncharacterized protein LY89DRAFT_721844 [Mollisia scopiformis]|uniref:Uncharacterized protein n=1 Tax=Mollisia scopiformis TaxID=149040 RepID=A0A194WYL8_MOLSC|nr:uncharacterized protein LY89DRAFT_721844 [Mollisia scopiformis]KUJ13053.1 hypothetical protein LY89DRAFT_721844 [Mollisia scopiformis]